MEITGGDLHVGDRLVIAQRRGARIPAPPKPGARGETSRVAAAPRGWARMSDALIEVRDLTKIYGEGPSAVKVLAGVSVTVQRGEFVAIMGPSGSGKSTFMHFPG